MALLSRRGMVFAGAAAALLDTAQARPPHQDYLPQPAPPRQRHAAQGYVNVPGARLYYWDTEGDGRPLLLAHAGSGSAFAWEYQQPAFGSAGYRVIAFSRRGYRGTEITDRTIPHSALADIDHLAEHLRLEKFHAVGTAAGGGIMLDYALSRPNRLLSLVVASAIGNIDDPAYRAIGAALYPEAFRRLPIEIQELGPSYRASNPQGVARWLELVSQAGHALPEMPARKRARWEDLASLSMPVLWMTGDADLFIPPSLLARFHKQTPGSEIQIVEDSGHSIYWEQPEVFNSTILSFLARHA